MLGGIFWTQYNSEEAKQRRQAVQDSIEAIEYLKTTAQKLKFQKVGKACFVDVVLLQQEKQLRWDCKAIDVDGKSEQKLEKYYVENKDFV